MNSSTPKYGGVFLSRTCALNGLICAFFWMWFVSRGCETPGILDAYYEIQAHALWQGQICILPGPDQAFYHDVSLFDGKYYFYWGMLPSAMHWALSPLLGRLVSSYLVPFAFVFSFLFFFQKLILEALVRPTDFEHHRPYWVGATSCLLVWMLVFNLPFPFSEFKTSWFFGRFYVYEQAIIFALGIAMPAMFALIRGLKTKNCSLLSLGILLWALAAWTRGTWLPIALLGLLSLALILMSPMKEKIVGVVAKKNVYTCACLSLILLFGVFVLNYYRFESFVDFGLKHQNPANYWYLRLLNGAFAPVTHVYNFFFKLFSYYGSPGIIEKLDLLSRSCTQVEVKTPNLFGHGPQLLILLLTCPLGIYHSARRQVGTLWVLVVVGLTALYLNALIASVGIMVIMRFFVECYYLTILFLFAAAVSWVPRRYSVPIFMALLAAYVPGNIEGFTTIEPRLRIVEFEEEQGDVSIIKTLRMPEPAFYQPEATWHDGCVSKMDAGTFKNYNTIGLSTGLEDALIAKDVSAVYVVPKDASLGGDCKAVLTVSGIRALEGDGSIHFFLDGGFLGEFRASRTAAADCRFVFQKRLQRAMPYQVLMAFFPEGSRYLPPRSYQSAFAFKGLSLQYTR